MERTYGRTTGWALVGGGVQRVRVGCAGASRNGERYLYLTPYAGGEEYEHPARLTATTKAGALKLAGEIVAAEVANWERAKVYAKRARENAEALGNLGLVNWGGK